MFKKLVKMMLFVFVVCAFCSISGQVSYARKGRKQSVKAEQKAREESKLPTKWKSNSVVEINIEHIIKTFFFGNNMI